MPELRITPAVAVVLRLLLSEKDQPRYGYELMRETGYASGKLYPLLARLCRAGWLLRESETKNSLDSSRPPRTYYRLSPMGGKLAQQALAEQSATEASKSAAGVPFRWQLAGDS